jgi:hypothetical protein
MTIDERKEHNKIKRAVDESLLETLQIVEDKQKERKSSWRGYLDFIGSVIPAASLAILGWLLLATIQTQKEIISMKENISQNTAHITEYTIASSARISANAMIHHVEPEQRCNACHITFYTVENADKARKLKSKGALLPHIEPDGDEPKPKKKN